MTRRSPGPAAAAPPSSSRRPPLPPPDPSLGAGDPASPGSFAFSPAEPPLPDPDVSFSLLRVRRAIESRTPLPGNRRSRDV